MQFTVKPIWKDQTCVILAGGPSLRGFNFDEEIGGNCKNFITINDSWRLLPSGTKAINYFCDHAWWSMQLQKNLRSLDGLTSFHDMIYRGFWVTISHDPGFIDHPQIHVLTNTGQRGLELDPSGLRHGSNAGYQAINLAVHLGAKRIVLLGYDMKVDGNRTNWHNEPRPQANAYADVIQRSMLPHYPTLIEPLKKLGVEVINATPDSALTCFPMMSLEEALKTVDVFAHAIPTDEHINEYRKRYDLDPYPTKPEKEDVGPLPTWDDLGQMEDWRS